MTEPLKAQDQIEKSFHDFLTQKTVQFRASKLKKSSWIKGMSDTSKAEETLKSIMSYFGTNMKERHRVLDVGCGFGNWLIVLAQHFEQTYGIEIQNERVQWVRKRASRAEVVCGSATSLPWPDEWFDLVVCTDVFEHISYKEQELAASELMRVLKPGGHGFISVPNRFQILDEHNRVLFATYLPDLAREKYVKAVTKNNDYIQCWERTGNKWKNLFESTGFQVALKPIAAKKLDFLLKVLPPNRYEVYLTK